MSEHSQTPVHILVAESAPILAAGTAYTLRNLPDLDVEVTEIQSKSALAGYVSSEHAEVLIVDPSFDGVFDPAALRRMEPGLKIVALRTGAVNKSADALYDASITVTDDLETIQAKLKALIETQPEDADGASRDDAGVLSSREKEIVALVVRGLTNKEIADRLFISVHTVITHRRNIARKLEIHSATGLTIYAIVNKIVDLSEIKI